MEIGHVLKCTQLLLVLGVIVFGQDRLPPRFEDFHTSVGWTRLPAALTLTTQTGGSFRTRLQEAVRHPPNFATHYRFTMWFCGSNCAAGAVIDLTTGYVIAPPSVQSGVSFNICQSAYAGAGAEFRVDSRLIIVRCGLNYDVQARRNVPDIYYFVLERQGFRKVAHFHGKRRTSEQK